MEKQLLRKLRAMLAEAEAVLVGAGAGLSTAAGYTYGGKRFRRLFAFCCVSTGEFHYPKQAAAEIAVHTVRDWLEKTGSAMKVVFNVFQDEDAAIYRELLG